MSDTTTATNAVGANDPAQTSIPFCATLGITTTEATPERVTLRLDWAPELCTVAGVMHGGAIMTLADSAGAICAFFNLPADATGTSTIQSSTSFIGAVTAGILEAVATPIHVGRTTIVVTTQVHNEGRLVATTTQTQSVLRPATDAPRR
jgi:uncharacterized protein (TIGR00369 family)